MHGMCGVDQEWAGREKERGELVSLNLYALTVC